MAIKIFIDQGHNPNSFNTGAEGFGLREQDITYRVGRELFALFAANANFLPMLSRESEDTVLGYDNQSSLSARVRAANSFGADLFLSLHCNASENPNVSGCEALVYSKSATVAYAVAGDILKRLTLATGLRNRGIFERPNLLVLKKTKMPAVLVELGFITNRNDATLLSESPGLFALGIYRGVLQYYGL